jgi:hypothetical protein
VLGRKPFSAEERKWAGLFFCESDAAGPRAERERKGAVGRWAMQHSAKAKVRPLGRTATVRVKGFGPFFSRAKIKKRSNKARKFSLLFSEANFKEFVFHLYSI